MQEAWRACADAEPPIRVLVGVLTAAKNREARAAVRETWGADDRLFRYAIFHCVWADTPTHSFHCSFHCHAVHFIVTQTQPGARGPTEKSCHCVRETAEKRERTNRCCPAASCNCRGKQHPLTFPDVPQGFVLPGKAAGRGYAGGGTPGGRMVR